MMQNATISSTVWTTRIVFSPLRAKRRWKQSSRQTLWRPSSPRSAEKPMESSRRGIQDEGVKSPPKEFSVFRTVTSDASSSRDAGTIWLCFINAALFVLSFLNRSWVQHLYLCHYSPHWWQFITCAFCHASWEHLSSNLFLLYVFGKLVEEKEGAPGVWATYLVCALGGSAAGYWLYPASIVSLGASGAVFGLFAVSVLIRLSWNWMKLVEVAILGQFVVMQLLNEVHLQLKGGAVTSASNVGHLAHLGGALMGVALMVLLHNLPDPENTASKTSTVLKQR